MPVMLLQFAYIMGPGIPGSCCRPTSGLTGGGTSLGGGGLAQCTVNYGRVIMYRYANSTLHHTVASMLENTIDNTNDDSSVIDNVIEGGKYTKNTMHLSCCAALWFDKNRYTNYKLP